MKLNNYNIRLAADVQPDSTVDGPGLRTVVWTQGCQHKCPQCHNPQTHNMFGGRLTTVSEVIAEIDKYNQNITLSGGDPALQPLPCSVIARHAKSKGLDVWMYTGYTFEDLMQIMNGSAGMYDLLHNIDVLVDGRFRYQQKSLDILYRGSTNQRIIDVPASLEKGYAVLHELSSVRVGVDSDASSRFGPGFF